MGINILLFMHVYSPKQTSKNFEAANKSQKNLLKEVDKIVRFLDFTRGLKIL